MNAYYADNIDGCYPVGALAIIVANSEKQAKELLAAEISHYYGREVKKHELEVNLIDTTFKPKATIILDGDY